MNNKKAILALASAILIIAGCSKFQDGPPLNRVTLMYVAAFSSLYSDLNNDINDMCAGNIPTLRSGDVLLVYAHIPNSRSLITPTKPVLFRAYRKEDGTYVRDTLKSYPDTDLSSSAEVMRKVLTDVHDMFPAPHYALTVSSHGKGWIPKGYNEFYDDDIVWSSAPAGTKEFCIEQVDGSGINVDEIPDAIPFKLDYIMMDSCLMGAVETAYELRNKCDYLLFSPTEVMNDGMEYKSMAAYITNVSAPDLVRVARAYYESYNSQKGNQNATVSVIKCSALDGLADVCRELIAAHREDIAACDHDSVQKYFRGKMHWFFDLRDIFLQSGASEEELQQLDAALKATVLYEAHTESFISIPLERVCGLSMYLPYEHLNELNDYYRTLAWNKATNLIQ